MQTSVRSPRQSTVHTEDSLIRTALDAVRQIEAEAKQKKMQQFESLRSAKVTIEQRLGELNHQLAQIDAVISTITGSPSPTGKRIHRNWDEARERVKQWLAGRKGQKFAASDLIREFPELKDTVMSVFLKAAIREGNVQVDTSEGVRRSKYFVAE